MDKLYKAVFFHADEASAPFVNKHLLDEEKEADKAEFYDVDEEEPAERSRWMAPSVFGNIFGGAAQQQPDPEMVDEISRRGGYPQGSAAQSKSAKSAAISKRKASPSNKEKSEMRGSFEKRSPGWVDGWRERSYLLKDRKLLYFPKSHPDRPLGVIDFDLVRYELHCCWAEEAAAAEERQRSCDVCSPLEPEDWGTFFMKPFEYPDKVFAFRGPIEEMKILAGRIAQIIKTRKFSEIDKNITEQNFWRIPFVCAEDLRNRADNGDILLFRGRGGRCQLLRSLTAGKYDHVAMFLRSDEGTLLLLEATGSDGVSLIQWKNFVGWGWHTCYERLAFRKVYFERNNEQMEALQRYVHFIIGSRYSLTYDKIFKKRNSFSFDAEGIENTPDDLKDNAGSQTSAPGSYYGNVAPGPENFFCSELVAACLKRCGVFAGARASCTYWPSSFSQYDPNSLPLHQGVNIGQEEIIAFPK